MRRAPVVKLRVTFHFVFSVFFQVSTKRIVFVDDIWLL